MDIFGGISFLLGQILKFCYFLVGNYGWAIILFTLITKLILLPFGIKQQKSTAATQKLQPKLKELQEKYKNDKEKLNIETMALYKKHKVNPMSGCLVLLIQFPIIICLYMVIRRPIAYILGVDAGETWRIVMGLTDWLNAATNGGNVDLDWVRNFITQGGILTADWVEQFKNIYTATGAVIPENFFNGMTIVDIENLGGLEINILQAINKYPEILDHIHGLSLAPIDMNFYVLNLADTPNWQVPSILWSIPILSGLTTYFSSKMMPQPPANADAASPANPMQSMTIIFPFMTAFFAFSFPAGVGLYWVASNVFQLAQQYFFNKYLTPKYAEEVIIEDEKNRKKRKKSR